MANPLVNDEVKIFAGIGVVCVEWALLEHIMLAIISSAENYSLEKTYMVFGGLDMLPRINLALKLTRHAKWPRTLSARIEAIRVEVQGKSGRHGLQEKRNQLVHGVHAPSTKPESTRITMPRWGEPKRTEDISAMQVYELAKRLSSLAEEAGRIFDDYGTWKFGTNSQKDSSKQGAETEPSLGIKIAQYAQSALKRLIGNK